MKTKIASLCTFLLIVLNAGAQLQKTSTIMLKGKYETCLYEGLKEFKKVSLACPADVVYEPAETYRVKVTTSKSVIDDIKIDVYHNTLHISPKSNFSKIEKAPILRITIYAPSVHKFEIRGSGNLYIEQPLNHPDETFEAVIMGSGAMHIANLSYRNVICYNAGSGDINITNLKCTNRLRLNVRGSGDMEIKRLVANELQADLLGSGDIEVERMAIEHLYANLTGSGNMDFGGVARDAELFEKGSGSINTQKLKTLGISHKSQKSKPSILPQH